MKADLLGSIAILSPDRTSVTSQTTLAHAAILSRLCFHECPASGDCKPDRAEGTNRTRRKTRLVAARIARVNNRPPRLASRYAIRTKQDRPAITVPEAIFRMDQQPKRRRFQSFRGHRPLLKRMPGLVRGEHRFAAKPCRCRVDLRFRPCIQRITYTGMHLMPGSKHRPETTTAMTDKTDGSRRLPTSQQWRRTFLWHQPSTRLQATRHQRRRNSCVERQAIHPAPHHCRDRCPDH